MTGGVARCPWGEFHPYPLEVIHTTANHPWLTADRGWVLAGDLRPGERVVTLPGQAGSASAATTATVAWVRAAPGAGEMDNLTVAQDHTYAVGDAQAVVHNTEGCSDLIEEAEAATAERRPSAVAMRIYDASGEEITLPEMTFTSDTRPNSSSAHFEDIIQSELKNVPHAGGCGERWMCGALYEHAAEVKGGHIDAGLWHEKNNGPCSACVRIIQRTSNDLNVTFHIEAVDPMNDRDFEPEWG